MRSSIYSSLKKSFADVDGLNNLSRQIDDETSKQGCIDRIKNLLNNRDVYGVSIQTLDEIIIMLEKGMSPSVDETTNPPIIN